MKYSSQNDESPTEDMDQESDLPLALDAMLAVLRCVNDSMHQVAISGYQVIIRLVVWQRERERNHSTNYISVLTPTPSLFCDFCSYREVLLNLDVCFFKEVSVSGRKAKGTDFASLD